MRLPVVITGWKITRKLLITDETALASNIQISRLDRGHVHTGRANYSYWHDLRDTRLSFNAALIIVL